MTATVRTKLPIKSMSDLAPGSHIGFEPRLSWNQSGIQPTEYKILIAPKLTQEKSKGGIILPDTTKERDQHAQMEGVIVATSPLAFSYDNWKDASPPKVGDRVLFAKYAGALVTGADGKDYRLTNDKDVAAVLI